MASHILFLDHGIGTWQEELLTKFGFTPFCVGVQPTDVGVFRYISLKEFIGGKLMLATK